ncbi:hypothetical protein [Stenotrophomonas rhizophila]
MTLLGTSVLSAVVLGGLEPIAPAVAGSEARATVDTVATDTDLHTPPPPSLQEPAITPDPDLAAPATSAAPVVGMSRTGRILLGLFALPLAAVGGGIFMGTANPIFGLFVAVGLYVGLYAFVYERSGRSFGRGIGIGIALLLGLFAVGALEMMLWLSVMK